MRPASYLNRAGALVLDTIVLSLIIIPVYLLISVLGFMSLLDTASPDAASGAFIVIIAFSWIFSLLVGMVYYGITMTRPGFRNGQTLGKQVLDVRVVNADGAPFTWGSVLKRELLAKGIIGIVGSITLGLLSLLDYLWPLWDDRAQALHDKVAKTFVVDASGSSTTSGFVGGHGSSTPASADPMNVPVPVLRTPDAR